MRERESERVSEWLSEWEKQEREWKNTKVAYYARGKWKQNVYRQTVYTDTAGYVHLQK